MKPRKRKTWQRAAMNLALNIAKDRSEDPYVQVGAVAVKHDGSLSVGYNGAPAGININWEDRDERRAKVVHAEANVLNFCKPGEVDFLVVTHMPCPDCLKTIAIKKIKTVYFNYYPENYPRQTSFDVAKEFGVGLWDLSLLEKNYPNWL
jgi:deoxycytidylate deaminase|tara:strand:- start:8723 stop:9169 length:447 start_codon:yes stop_codon:yes gene_type:complete